MLTTQHPRAKSGASRKRRAWSPAQERFLRQAVSDHLSLPSVACMLGMTDIMVMMKMDRLGIKYERPL